MSHEARISEVPNPGVLKDAGPAKMVGFTALSVGIAAFAVQYVMDSNLAWASYLQGFFYAFCLALAGGVFVAINNVTQSVWVMPFRRICESMTSFLPWTILLIIPILLVAGDIYEWADESSHLYGTKADYLSVGFWAIRIFAFIVLMAFFTGSFRSASLAQDTHRQGLNNVGKSAGFLILFGFGFTLFSIDLLMSLRPHWFSTMYGVYCFAGLLQAGFCVMILSTIYLKERGYFAGILKDRHLFDLGTWLLAWCTFMAYIGFSQFMLIWYANLPEETPFFIDHLYEQWGCLYVIIFCVKWVIPFFVLMPKPFRRHHLVLKIMCTAILLIEWVDIYWMVFPEFVRFFNVESLRGTAFSSHFVLSFLVGMGFLGAFILAMVKFLGKNSIVPIGEPKLLSSVNGDYL
jgi:hypothetical protein